MATLLPPPPIADLKEWPHSAQEWLRKVWIALGGNNPSGTIPWAQVSKSGSTLTDITTRNHNDLQNIQGGTSSEYYHLTNAQQTNLLGGNQSWVPTRTNWTDVGTPAVTARYTRLLNIVHFQVKIVPATTVATVAGTSYISLPITAAGLAGDASMGNVSTLLSIGNCEFDITNSRCYVPTQGATGNTLTIAGWYEV